MIIRIIQNLLRHFITIAIIEGKITTRKWQDQSGQDRYTTEIVANEMQMLDSRAAQEQPAQRQTQQQNPPPSQQFDIDDSNIPF